ncbi:MAG: autotransporter-associated beta strand repeat-containing protein [Planctomycetia bacterium]|nr:autotransporter-associated beta strand repeat-containing protein [Planctomycetia bacterium]
MQKKSFSRYAIPQLNKSKYRPRLEILEDRCVPATRTWDGGALSNNWSNASNWVGNIAPVAGDDLIFPAGNFDKTADNDYTPGTHFRSISVGGGYTLKGNRVFLGVGGVIDNSGTSNIIKNDLDLGAAAGATPRVFQVGAGSTLFIDGEIRGGNGLNKTGTGNLSFRGHNTFVGLTQVSAGQLFVTKDDGLGSTAAGTLVKSGATLVADHSATLIGTLDLDEPLTLEGGSRIRALRQVELNGDIVLLGTADITQEAATEELFIDGSISGPGGLNLIAQNKLWLRGSGFNSYLGTTSATGDVRLQKSDRNRAFSGDLVIQANSSVTMMDYNQFGFIVPEITVNSGGKLRLNGYTHEVGTLHLNGGRVSTAVVVPDLHNILTPLGGLYLKGDITGTSTASGPSRLDGTVSLFSSEGHTITVADGPSSTDMIIDMTIDGGDDDFVKEGNGTLELSAREEDYVFDSYTGTLFVNAGTLLLKGSLKDSEVRVEGGRLSGTGDMGGLSCFGGIVAPGTLNGPGILHLTGTSPGSVILSGGDIFSVRLNGPVAGTGHDQLDVGNFTSNDDRRVFIRGASLVASVGAGASPGNQFRIINNEGNDAIVLDSATPGFVDPLTGALIGQGDIFTTANGVRLSMDYHGGTGNDVVLTYVNTPPMAPDLALNTTEINEGGTVTATGSLVDPDAKDRLRLFINWGDGSRQEVHRPGRDLFSFTHRYRQDGVYTARFEWIDQTGQGNSREFTITVNNVAPTLKLRTFRTFNTGLLMASGWLSDAGDDRYTATLDFGDGTSRTKTLNWRDYFAIAHKYKNPGNYILTLTLRDSQGAESIFQREVVIS